MELPLVAGVDGSDGSRRAVDWAVDEAARYEVPLRLVYASLWERYEGVSPSLGTDRPAEQMIADNIVSSAAERARLRNPEVKVTTEVLPDEAVHALLREAEHAVAVVVGSRGRGGLAGLMLGSVGLSVAARASCPVIVVRGPERNVYGSFNRIVLGVGDAPESAPTVRFAFREAEVRHCEIDAVRGWPWLIREIVDHPFLAGEMAHAHEEQAENILTDVLGKPMADHPRVVVHQASVCGPAHRVLVEASATADLLVVGALRRYGHMGLQFGRVSHIVLHHAACPVAVVPHRA